MIQISTDKTRLDIPRVHEYLSKEAYWALGRDLEIVKQSVENSLCFGMYSNDKQIGFTRIVTDYAVIAWVLDVFYP